MRGALPPVDPEILDEERRDDHPRAVVHPALGRELPHARRRRAGSRSSPPSRRASPSASSSQTSPRGRKSSVRLSGPGPQQLRVEVPPAELAHEGLAARTRPLPARRATWRRRSRGAGTARAARSPSAARSSWPPVAVRRRDRRAASAAAAATPRALAARAEPRRRWRAAAAGPDRRRQEANRRRRRQRVAERHLRPGAVVGREDLEEVAPRRSDLARRDDACPVDEAQVAAPRRAAASRRRAYGLTSALAKTVVAPTSRASAARSRPRRRRGGRSSAPPRSRSESSRSARHSSRNAPTGRCRSEARRPERDVLDEQRHARPRAVAHAAWSAGLSWTRRSRVRRTTAVGIASSIAA